MTTCQWIDWCTRDAPYTVELSNRAGTERIEVCRLHVAPARLHGFEQVDSTSAAKPTD